jgi:hypothetical protein
MQANWITFLGTAPEAFTNIAPARPGRRCVIEPLDVPEDADILATAFSGAPNKSNLSNSVTIKENAAHSSKDYVEKHGTSCFLRRSGRGGVRGGLSTLRVSRGVKYGAVLTILAATGSEAHENHCRT